MQTTYRIIDVETTGLDTEQAEVVEMAYKDWPEDWPEGWRMQSLYRPSHPIPAEARAIHHITDDQVAGREPFTPAEIFPGGEVPPGAVPVAHNVPFDAAATGTESWPWLDTRRLAMHLFPDAPRHSNQVLRYYLDDLGLLPGLPEEAADEFAELMPHRALADVYVTWGIFTALIEEAEEQGYDPDQPEQLLALAARPVELKTVPFGKHFGKPWDEVPTDYLLWMRGKEWDTDVAHTRDRALERRQAGS
ncbi:MAG TPA: exonuclease domain-containing protein [Gammaproteobacteria bacterium]|nr:exonuclease domain-containing protein [Gammaproteobacteria bacterium]